MDSIRPSLCQTGHHKSHAHHGHAGSGPQDTVTLGEMPPHNCWDPRKFKTEAVRPEVGAQVDKLASSDCTGVKATTREIPRLSIHTPKPPQPFAAQRFQFTFQDDAGVETGYIFETEAGPGHMQPVTPGKTEIPGGYISILKDKDNAFGEATRLNTAEVDRLLDKVTERFKSPMTDSQAELLQHSLDAGYSIRYAGEGAAAVKSAHAQRVG